MSEVKVNKVSPRSGTGLQLGDSGDTITIPAGATLTNSGTATGFGDNLEWQSSIVTAATFTASAGRGYWIDTTSNACTITMPGSANVGDQIIFVDYARNWATNAITLSLNGLKYQNGTSNPVYDTKGQSVNIIYSGATNGWIPISDDAVADEGAPPPYNVDFLVIAGGGGGAKGVGGGGGAGGYRNSFNSESSGGGGSSETALALNIGTAYTVTVGAGGTGGTSNAGTSGVASSISGSDITSITSVAGGKGGSLNLSISGDDGGSGGGGGGGGTGNNGDGTANQGFAGGQGNNGGGQACAGGGGGASAVGSAGSTSAGGNGGNGLASSITGSAVTRAGGAGGSGRNSGSVGSGGSGGGGNGGVLTTSGTAGTVNTGSGGGGSHDVNGLAGGSGVIILRMATTDYSGTTTGSPTVDQSTVSGQTILIYNGSGSYTG